LRLSHAGAFQLLFPDIVSSNISVFEEFTPDQMKEFAANMANAFEKFTLELEAITQERDEMVLFFCLHISTGLSKTYCNLPNC